MKIIICFTIILSNCFWSFSKDNFNDRIKYDTSRYDSKKILDRFCGVLNEVKELYKFEPFPIKFTSKNGKPLGFFVYDLTDTTNNSTTSIVKFKEGHVYHFAAGYLYYSVSNICVLKEGKLIFFKALNCKEKIDSIRDVVKYLKLYLPNNLESQRIINRTLDYRKYGRYLKIDYSICKCEN